MAFGKSYADRSAEIASGKFLVLSGTALGAGFRLITPRREHPLVVRVIPYYSKDHERVLPYREPGYGTRIAPFTDWIWPMNVWKGGVNNTFLSFISDLPGDQPGTLAPASVRTPVERLYDTTKRLIDTDQHAPDGTPWSKFHTLLAKRPNRGAMLDRPTTHVFMHVFRLMADGKSYQKSSVEDNARFILMGSKSVKTALEKMCNDEVPDYRQRGIDPESPARYKCGNWIGNEPVEVNGRTVLPGRLLTISFDGAGAKHEEIGDYDFEANQSRGMSGDSREAGWVQYSCELGKEMGIPPEFPARYTMPWEDCLQLHDAPKQVSLLAQAGFPIVLLRAAFADTDWLSDALRKGKLTSIPEPGATKAGVMSEIGTPVPGGGPAASESVEPAEEDIGFVFGDDPSAEALPLGSMAEAADTPRGPVGVQPDKPATTSAPVATSAPSLDPAVAGRQSAAELARMKSIRQGLSQKTADSVPVKG